MVSSPLYTFPPISWWVAALGADCVYIDPDDLFRKMSYRNRYRVAGSNNPVLLSIPLAHGRDQQGLSKDIMIFDREQWQVRHWRTLVSVYRRTPFFEYYEPSLAVLFQQHFDRLADFNLAALHWVNQQLNGRIQLSVHNDVSRFAVLPVIRHAIAENKFPKYYQIFEDRIGFQPDLSILDLLFSEGIHTITWLSACVQQNLLIAD